MKENYINLYNISKKGYDTLEHLLSILEKHVVDNNLSEEEFLDAKLAEDMFSFKRQIQLYTDVTLGVIYRLAGEVKPVVEDMEISIADLRARLNLVRNHLEKKDPNTINLDLAQKIKLPWMPPGAYFEVPYYLNTFGVMNSLFHLTTAYSILRMKGLKIGKIDFLVNGEMKFEQN